MVDLAEGNYKKALNKATYYVGEIEEKLNYGAGLDTNTCPFTTGK